MKKIKIFSSYHEDSLELDVNEFIASHNVVDIQYHPAGGGAKLFTVMVVYEE